MKIKEIDSSSVNILNSSGSLPAFFNNFFVFCVQELQKGLDNHKSEVLSINLRSADFLQTEPESEEAWELRDGLKEMNSRWARLGGSLEDWREELQRALMQCQVAGTVM